MKALVTGGGGFLGSAIARQLRERGDEVRTLARGHYPELDTLGAEQISGDIRDADAVKNAAAGCDAIFHVAAKAGVWGEREDYLGINYQGTLNVIEACHAHGIGRLIHTSTPSVVFNGKDMEGVDESVPYADHFEAHYPETKAMAERAVLEANGSGLKTVALRPHLIWGPGDNHLVPRILARAKQLRIIGDGTNRVDTTFIDDAARAHVLACDALATGSGPAGKAYFISSGDPRPLWDVVNDILAAGDFPPLTRRVSPALASAIGGAMETVYGLLRIKSEPKMTRFVAGELATAHWFDISAAERDFGYTPQVDYDEGMDRLREWIHREGLQNRA